jgi:putative ABC transport system permease protein
MEAGETPGEAMNAARRAFGSVVNIQEDVRESWGWAGIERFVEDIRFGLRMLRRTPVWTAAVSSMLALGIGLSIVIFSVVYGVLPSPLPSFCCSEVSSSHAASWNWCMSIPGFRARES